MSRQALSALAAIALVLATGCAPRQRTTAVPLEPVTSSLPDVPGRDLPFTQVCAGTTEKEYTQPQAYLLSDSVLLGDDAYLPQWSQPILGEHPLTLAAPVDPSHSALLLLVGRMGFALQLKAVRLAGTTLTSVVDYVQGQGPASAFRCYALPRNAFPVGELTLRQVDMQGHPLGNSHGETLQKAPVKPLAGPAESEQAEHARRLRDLIDRAGAPLTGHVVLQRPNSYTRLQALLDVMAPHVVLNIEQTPKPEAYAAMFRVLQALFADPAVQYVYYQGDVLLPEVPAGPGLYITRPLLAGFQLSGGDIADFERRMTAEEPDGPLRQAMQIMGPVVDADSSRRQTTPERLTLVAYALGGYRKAVVDAAVRLFARYPSLQEIGFIIHGETDEAVRTTRERYQTAGTPTGLPDDYFARLFLPAP